MDTLTLLFHLGATVAGLLLLAQLLLGIRFARLVAAYRRSTLQLTDKGSWPKGRPPPRSLQRRCAYLTGRFARHAPRWEVVIWLRALAMQASAAAVEFILRHEYSMPARNAARYSFAALTLLVILATWRLQRRFRPYALR